MFQKTRIRLVTLNSIIMLFVLISLGLTIYFYTEYRLYVELDNTLIQTAENQQSDQFEDFSNKSTGEREEVRRNILLLWDPNQQLLAKAPEEAFNMMGIEQFKASLSSEGVKTLAIQDHFYRVLTVSVKKAGLPESLKSASVLQVIQNIEPERNMLNSLFLVLLMGGLVGVGVSLLMGCFLAQKALVPIKNSWHKQQTFVANASHELRTPLTVVQANLELLYRHPEKTIEEESEKISFALNEAKRMTKLVAELLTLARSGSVEPEFSFKYFTFDIMLNEVVEQFRWLAQSKNIELSVSADEKINVMGDPDRLRQLLVILLDNAVKYTPVDGKINVLCRQQRQRVEIIIEDTGIGITEEDLPYIFDRFFRADKSRTRSESGSGLGLSIAKWIIEGHSGIIRAESKPGQGTKLYFQVPLKQKTL
ncbi:HAMP domain-containing sensor histidine kinase [Desulfosporosinus sp. OT]|uniref:sensor histidine kinase n=1 Tax=Desulfosporosinus sp. OT TaxID=913865 RepID=UPI00058EB3D7|nr:HAMP domain-containing sensor histidine kinase [Desulfosporosinus sp. OT]